MRIGILYLDASDAEVETKIRGKLFAYHVKTGIIPDTVQINPSQIGTLKYIETVLDGSTCKVNVVPDKQILKNHFFVGREEIEEISSYEKNE